MADLFLKKECSSRYFVAVVGNALL